MIGSYPVPLREFLPTGVADRGHDASAKVVLVVHPRRRSPSRAMADGFGLLDESLLSLKVVGRLADYRSRVTPLPADLAQGQR